MSTICIVMVVLCLPSVLFVSALVLAALLARLRRRRRRR